jgi:hypothetical protein
MGWLDGYGQAADLAQQPHRRAAAAALDHSGHLSLTAAPVVKMGWPDGYHGAGISGKKKGPENIRALVYGGGAVLKKAKANSLSKVRAIRRDRCCPPWRKNGCPPHLRWSFRPFEVPGSSKILGANCGFEPASTWHPQVTCWGSSE